VELVAAISQSALDGAEGPVFWLELVLMMLVTAPFWWANKALPSLLNYRDRMSEREGASGIDKHEGEQGSKDLEHFKFGKWGF
jgi:hypothetical protein